MNITIKIENNNRTIILETFKNIQEAIDRLHSVDYELDQRMIAINNELLGRKNESIYKKNQ